jgi:hypothetical protein
VAELGRHRLSPDVEFAAPSDERVNMDNTKHQQARLVS